MAQYVRQSQAPAIKAKQKQQAKRKTSQTEMERSIIFKRILLIVFVFLISLAFMNQYSRIINVSSQINSLETEIKQTDNLIDITEGKVLSTVNWDEIENKAKNQLGMIEPTKDNYTVIQLKDLPAGFDKTQAGSDDKTDKTGKSNLSLLINYFSN
ncbi:MAG: septum formation initiator family protein [Eubacteriaceae bacterium]